MQRRDQQGNNEEGQENNSGRAKDTSFKRKGNDGSVSERKGNTSGKPNRPSQRSFDQVSVSSATKSNLGATEEDNEKLMVLSNEAKEALKSMQRFDRFIYVTESEKKLKIPIENQLKRLQKIKNSGNKLMRNTFFDNELTITCLFNHMKNLYEIARELGEIVTLKAEIEVLQQKIIEMNVKFNKELKEAATSAKGKAAEDQQTLKDTLKIIDTLIYSMKEKNVEKGRRKIEADLKRATDTRKELLELVHGLLGRVGGGAVVENIQTQEDGGADIYQLNLSKLIQDQGSVEKNLVYLQSQKTFFEKSIKESKSTETKGIYTELKDTSIYLIELNTTIKNTETSLLASQKKAVGSNMSEEDKQKLKQFQELESIISRFEQDGDLWHKEMELINIKMESGQSVAGDLNKNRKALGNKKQLNETVWKLASSYLGLLELSSKKSQDGNSVKQLQERYNKSVAANQALQTQLKKLKKQLESSNSKDQAEVNKFLSLLQQVLTLKEGEEIVALSQYQRLKKYMDLNRKKIPEEFLSTFNSVETLIRTIIDNETYIKQKEADEQKNEQLRTKEISNLDAIFKPFEKLISSNDPINDGFLNKLSKSIEPNLQKIDKLGESPLNSLFKTYNSYITRLIELLSTTHKSSKSKGDSDSVAKQEAEQLRTQLKGKEAELLKSTKTITELEAKINKLNLEIEKHRSQESEDKNSVAEYKRSIASLEKEKAGLERNLATLEKDKANLAKRLEDSETRANELKVSLAELRDSSKKESSQDQRRVTEIKNYQKRVTQLQKQLGDSNKEIQNLNQEIEQLNRRLAETSQQLSVLTIQFRSQEQNNLDLSQQIQFLNAGNLELEGANQQNLEELERLRRENSELQNRVRVSEGEMTGEKNQILNLVNENARLSRELQELQQRYNGVVGEIENNQRELEQRDINLKSLEEQIRGVRGEYSQLEVNSQRHQSDLTNSNNALKGELDSLKRAYNTLEVNFQSQTSRLQEAERAIASKNNSSGESSIELNNLRIQVQDLEGRLAKSHLENGDLHTKINSSILQISTLQSQIRNLEIQTKDKNMEIEKARAVQKPSVVLGSGQFDVQRYQALKDENVMLKEQIVLRDLRIDELLESPEHGGVSNISQVSVAASARDQEIIRKLERELLDVKMINSRDSRTNPQHERLLVENRELSEAVRSREINLQNALGDNDFLYRQLNKYKEGEIQLQSKIASLNRELATKTTLVSSPQPTSNINQISSLERNNSALLQQKLKLQSETKILQRQVYEYRLQINTSNNEVQTLRQRIQGLQASEESQKRMIEELMKSVGTRGNDGGSLMEKKMMELESSIKAIATGKNNDENMSLRSENTELKDRIRALQSESRTMRVDYSVDDPSRRVEDRLSDLLKEKLQYVKTIKSMQSLLHSKDMKLMQLYDQREIDLRNFIHESKRLQEEVNRINEKLIQEKVKHLISPQFLEQSLTKMEGELVELKKENIILKGEIQVLELELVERDKGTLSNHEGKSSSSIGLDKSLYEKVRVLEAEKGRLVDRVGLLNVYHRIQNQSQALVSNVNRLVDGILLFLNQSDDFADCDFGNNEFLPVINESLKNQDYQQYFENVEDLLKDLFFRVVGRKNEILDKQAQQLLLLREKMEELLEQEGGFQDDSYSKSFYQRPRGRFEENDTKKKASLIALQHLFKLYLKAKDPAVLREISELLTMSQGRRGYYYE